MRKVELLLGSLLLLSLTAAAQDNPKAEASFGYSYVRANPNTSGVPSFNLQGGSASLAYNPSDRFGIVGDFGGYHVGSISGTTVNSNLYTYLFGPRFSLRGKVTPYAQALFGGAHITGGALASSQNSFAMTVGGGVDVKVTDHVAIRLGQAEYLMTRFREIGPRVTQNNLRLSTGIVFRW